MKTKKEKRVKDTLFKEGTCKGGHNDYLPRSPRPPDPVGQGGKNSDYRKSQDYLDDLCDTALIDC
jgi:hypothetical protein